MEWVLSIALLVAIGVVGIYGMEKKAADLRQTAVQEQNQFDATSRLQIDSVDELWINENDKTWCVPPRYREPLMFSDILDADIVQDGETFLPGVTGAVRSVDSLQVAVATKSLYHPSVAISLIVSPTTASGALSEYYKERMAKAVELKSLFLAMKGQG